MRKTSDGRDLVVMQAGEGEFEVKNNLERRTYIVKLKQRACSYGYWKLSGIPCIHVVSCLGTFLYIKVFEIDYFLESYLNTYRWDTYIGISSTCAPTTQAKQTKSKVKYISMTMKIITSLFYIHK